MLLIAMARSVVYMAELQYVMRTSGFPDDVMLFHNGTYHAWRSEATAAASLRCRARTNTPAACYWLHSVLDNGGRQD